MLKERERGKAGIFSPVVRGVEVGGEEAGGVDNLILAMGTLGQAQGCVVGMPTVQSCSREEEST